MTREGFQKLVSSDHDMLSRYEGKIATIVGKKDFWWKFRSNSYDYDHIGEWHLVHMTPNYYSKVDRETPIATFSLTQLPACCGVCVGNSAATYDPFRNKGLGTLLNKMRIDMATEAGFGIMLATDISHNTPNVKIFDKNGWKKIYEFANPRTANVVDIRVIQLENYPEEDDGYDDDDY